MDITAQERTLLQTLANGLSVEEAAAHQSLSVTAVRTMLTTIRQKLQVSSNLEAIVLALRMGLISFPTPAQERTQRSPPLQEPAAPAMSLVRQEVQFIVERLSALAAQAQLPAEAYDLLKEALSAVVQVRTLLDEPPD